MIALSLPPVKEKQKEPRMSSDGWSEMQRRRLVEGLCALWETGHYTDIRIRVSSQWFHCHRIVLVAMSAYFRAMFASGMRESQEGLVTLHNVSPDLFGAILAFLYSGKLELSRDNCADFLQAATLFQIGALQEACEQFLVRTLTMSSCLPTWRLARSLSCLELQAKAWTYIVENFPDVSRTEEFRELSQEELTLVINDDNLHVASEETVFKAAMAWLNHNCKQVEELMAFVQNLRTELLSASFLDSMLAQHACLREDPEVESYIRQTHFHAAGGVTPPPGPPPRERNEPVLVMVDGRRREVTCFSLQQKKSFSLAKFPYFADGKAACVCQGNIFVCGGFNNNPETRLVQFYSQRNRWEERMPMASGRCYHELVAVGSCLYAVGGFVGDVALSSIEEFDLETGQWDTVGHLAVPVGGHCAASLGSTIFVFGGKTNRMDNKTATFQAFDTSTRTAMMLGTLPARECWSRALVVDDIIYVVCPDGYVMQFSGQAPPVISLVMPTLDCEYFSVMAHQNQILILQVGDTRFHDRMVILDRHTGRLDMVREKLPRSLSDSIWLKVIINRSHLKYECAESSRR